MILLSVVTYAAALLLGFVAVYYVVSIYNSFQVLRNNIGRAFANIDVLLKQRNDEVPNLMAVVKGYAGHERAVFEDVARARAAVMGAGTVEQKGAASNALTEALKSVFAVAENYPRLKASEGFLKIQERISGLENEIADRREFYNNSVTLYNTRLQVFPDVIMASALKLQPEPLFQASGAERQSVRVGFGK